MLRKLILLRPPLMRAPLLRSLAVALGISIAIAGCSSDNPAAPSRSVTPTAPSNSLLSSAITVKPVHRLMALSAPITVTKTIGILGGTIAIPSVGLTVVFPPLALTSPKTISVTALAGPNIAYEFAPHGLKFLAPVVMTQNLTGTEVQSGLVLPVNLFTGYFPDASNPTSVTKTLGVGVSLLNLTAVTTIWHFSGYIMAGGRA